MRWVLVGDKHGRKHKGIGLVVVVSCCVLGVNGFIGVMDDMVGVVCW